MLVSAQAQQEMPNAPAPQPAPAAIANRLPAPVAHPHARRAWQFRIPTIRLRRMRRATFPSPNMVELDAAATQLIRDGKLYISLQDAIDACAGKQS